MSITRLLHLFTQSTIASSLYNSGFAEAAADVLFASMVQLDLEKGGSIGKEGKLYDSTGKLIRNQGSVFNSPLHFVGFRNNTGSLDPDISPAWSAIESGLVDQLIFDYNKKLDITAGVFDTKEQNWSVQPKTRAPEALTEAQNQGNTNPTNLEANGIRIPGWTWKTILVSNKSNLGVQDILGSYTYITPNIPEPYTNWIGQPAVPNPLNQLLGESRDPITSAEQWRRPNTWKLSINQLESLLNTQGSDKVFNFLSNLPEDVRNRIKQQSDFQFPPP
ncbi:MAG: hypothetical protein JGK21_04165 [Microcoleus sp. PH2017_22_RUC_O_B]|uniref:hypothetical protein n=1 Tax=unclassified Microcoleus TaxID=2642155 RepID=UPI001D3B11FA|nr:MULTISPECIES: hypothetical protein [unclassified Microcoleus]MCC3531588.1 hypothetical protein [Microcoleus sp. PH2017_21_RUC_O_A]MCC3539591.1 hypothetical protein [Microcoleus sp. PH2017_22_RUC_O_B]